MRKIGRAMGWIVPEGVRVTHDSYLDEDDEVEAIEPEDFSSESSDEESIELNAANYHERERHVVVDEPISHKCVNLAGKRWVAGAQFVVLAATLKKDVEKRARGPLDRLFHNKKKRAESTLEQQLD